MLSSSAFLNGISMTWDDVGSGPPILLIHGFPLCRELWKPQMTALVAAGYRVIVPDLRGFGQSDAGSGDCSMDLYADDLIELLNHLKIETAAVAGISMGGYVLFNLLERYPERFIAALFAVTRSLPDDEAGKQRRRQLAEAAHRQGPQAVADPFLDLLFAPGIETERPRLAEEAYRWMVTTATAGLTCGLLAMAGRRDATPLLADIRIPCLAVGAELDRAIPPEHSSMIADGIPGCGLAVIPGAGHLANLERPGDFNRAMLEFLRVAVPTPLNTDDLLCRC